MEEVENILRILKETKKALKKGDSSRIRKLSDQTINTASFTQDPDNIAVAVIVYSLSKIMEREHYRSLPGWESFYNTFNSSLENLIIAVRKKDNKEFKKNISIIRNAVDKLSGKLKIYIQDVFRKAQINKASRIYEHGISMEKTAKLLGITMFELAEYAGKTGIPDVLVTETMDIESRIKLAESMFE